MKKIYYIMVLVLLAAIFNSCEETEPTYETRLSNYPAPTISFTETIPDTISVMVEDGYPFSFHLEAEGGLSGMLLNDERVHISPYGQLKEDVSYTFVMLDVEDTTLVFSVVDEDGVQTQAQTVVAHAEGRLAPEFLVTDLSGAFIEFIDEPIPNQGGGNFAARVESASDYEIEDFTLRSLWMGNETTFNSVFTFNAEAPESGTAFKVAKNGGYTNIIVNLGLAIPEVYIADIISGKRVYEFDVYYDNSANPDAAGSLPMALAIDLYMANFSKYKNDKSGIFETYKATLPSANNWHTVKIRATGGGYHTGDVAINEIDAFSIKLSPGYNTQNPYYLRNFKIVKDN